MNDHTFLIQKTIPGESRVWIEYLEKAELFEIWSSDLRSAKRFATEEEARETVNKLRMECPDETISIVKEGA